MKWKSVWWIVGFTILASAALAVVAHRTVRVDPFFHYHPPLTDEYFYKLDNQRSMNNGIVRNFEYSGLITGTSMTENFKPSEAEALWGGRFIKVPFSGSTYKEINDNLIIALNHNPDLRVIIRGLDMGKFTDDKDEIRQDLGEYPLYLYDDNIFNDVQYIFNRNVVFSRVYPMTKENDAANFVGGITSFDDYSNWINRYKFGKDAVYPDGIKMAEIKPSVELTDAAVKTTRDNIRQNVTSLAEQYPDVTFYYFFPPYSIQFWQYLLERGTLAQQIEAERIVIEEILKCENIKLFSFNNLTHIITDLNNYKDRLHYGEWVNSLILQYMHDGKCLLTAENYEQYLSDELSFYSSFDYMSLNDQEDYEDDSRAAELLSGTELFSGDELTLDPNHIQLSHAEIVVNQYDGKPGVLCRGSLQRDYRNTDVTVSDYLRDTDYCGFRYTFEDISPFHFITYCGKKISDHGQPTVCIYDASGNVLCQDSVSYKKLDSEWHQYSVNVSGLTGTATIIFNGGYTDSTGSANSQYVFSNIIIK